MPPAAPDASSSSDVSPTQASSAKEVAPGEEAASGREAASSRPGAAESENGSPPRAQPEEEDSADGDGAWPNRFADEAMQRLEPEARTVWALKLGGMLLLLVGALFFYDLVRWLSGEAWPFVFSGAAFVVSAGATVAVPRLRWRYWRYALRTEELYLERGVFNRVRTVVPLRRVQHVDVSQDLFEREFDLGKLVVHTAGGRSSTVAVPGLRYQTAERLRDDVKRYVLDEPDEY